MHTRSDSPPTQDELLAQIAALNQEVKTLQREKAELALILEMTTEHADDVTDELHDLTEHLQKRAMQLEASSQLGRQVTSILKLEDLLPEVVKSIQAQFEYYFVGIFLLNEAQTILTLQASQGREKNQGTEVGFAIPMGSDHSIIASVCQNGQHYLAADVSVDPQYLLIDTLPDTCSELALPLHIGPGMIGVLDIQSERPAAFEAEDIRVLQSLADQIAIAIRNAQLYAQVVGFNEQLEQLVQQRAGELDSAYHKLERMDRTKSDFIEVAAHELRTPLTLIKGYAQLLQPIAQDDPQVQAITEGILSGQKRLQEVVGSLLDITKIGSHTLNVHKELISLAETFYNVQSALGAALQDRQVELSLADLDTLPLVLADPDLMFKLFNHLLINAIKYTPDGGHIEVKGKLLSDASFSSNTAPIEYVQILIKDSGIGIDPEHHELIFEKFYQTGQARLHSSGKTKFKGGGPGLGLSISKGIVEAHGGRIWVESPGYNETTYPGSTFYVLLPVAEGAAPELTAALP